MTEKNIIYDTDKKENELFRYYYINCKDYYSDKRIEESFEYLCDATTYAINSNNPNYEPYNLYTIIFSKDNKGRIKKESINMGKLPNRKNKEVDFYVLGKEEDNNLKVIYNFSNYNEIDIESFKMNERINDKNLGIYKVKVSIMNNKKLEYEYIEEDYELIRKHINNSKKRAKKKEE